MVLDPIIEFIAELLVGQAVRHGPQAVKKVWQKVRLSWRRRGFVSRSKFINRERELRAVRAALADTPRLRILYLFGPSGVGKTRLLEEAERLTREVRSRVPLCWSGVLDLYHI